MEEKPTVCVAKKAGIDEKNCFKEKGDTADEVVLKFDDSKELYVSEGFLSYASPVFKAMFTHECKEKTTREVELTGKDYADFHNFLLCLHPGVQKAVDRTNVLRISALANEYQVMPTVAKCSRVMIDWILSNTESEPSSTDTKYSRVVSSLEILHKALECDFEEVVKTAEANLSKFDYKIFTGLAQLPPISRYLRKAKCSKQATASFGSAFGQPAQTGFYFGTAAATTSGLSLGTTHVQPVFTGTEKAPETPAKKDNGPAECKRLFDDLPEKLKIRLLLARLRLCDDGQFRDEPERN